jgi:exodeoxyribonuclease VII large subunit
VPSLLAAATTRDAEARGRLTRAARSQLRVHGERVGRRSARLGRLAPECLEARSVALRADAARLGPFSLGHLTREEERVRSWRRLLMAYDVDRQLERGYSLTLTAGGELVRSAADVGEGEEIVTRLADGTVRSSVLATERTQVEEEENEGQ